MKKYIIDTDIGDDIDDAFALDWALKANVNLLGVTTVYRNVQDRARIAKRMISLYGKHIPVLFGYGSTLDGMDESFPLCQWTDEAGMDEFKPDNTRSEEAIDFILDAARRYKKDFYLLAVGPLTNVARAIEKDPVAMGAIGGVVLMGGDFVNHYAEWNIRCDVKAASVVFSSDADIVAFGHENTSRLKISKEEQDYVFSMDQDPYHAYLAEISRLWHKTKPAHFRIVLHDLMVIRYVLEPDYCPLESIPVLVETKGEYTRAMTLNLTLFDYLPTKKYVRVAKDVDVPEFIQTFMKNIGYAPKEEN